MEMPCNVQLKIIFKGKSHVGTAGCGEGPGVSWPACSSAPAAAGI